jgi:hypothetical protein
MPHAIRKKTQRATRGNFRVELSQTPGGGIARVDEFLVAVFALQGVEPLEILFPHQHFAAHFEHSGRLCHRQAQRNVLYRAQVRGDVFAGIAVAARCALHQAALLVAKTDGQSIEFRLAVIGHHIDAQRVAHTPIERFDVFVAEGVVE